MAQKCPCSEKNTTWIIHSPLHCAYVYVSTYMRRMTSHLYVDLLEMHKMSFPVSKMCTYVLRTCVGTGNDNNPIRFEEITHFQRYFSSGFCSYIVHCIPTCFFQNRL